MINEKILRLIQIKNNKTLIITTPLEQNSEDNYNDILFLGEWCKTYPYTKNPKVKSETLDYHWDDRNKLENDFFYLEDLYKKVLISLSNKYLLNSHKMKQKMMK